MYDSLTCAVAGTSVIDFTLVVPMREYAPTRESGIGSWEWSPGARGRRFRTDNAERTTETTPDASHSRFPIPDSRFPTPESRVPKSVAIGR